MTTRDTVCDGSRHLARAQGICRCENDTQIMLAQIRRKTCRNPGAFFFVFTREERETEWSDCTNPNRRIKIVKTGFDFAHCRTFETLHCCFSFIKLLSNRDPICDRVNGKSGVSRPPLQAVCNDWSSAHLIRGSVVATEC